MGVIVMKMLQGLTGVSDHEWRVQSELFEIRSVIAGCDTLLDLGCGPNSIMGKFSWLRSTGVDGFAKVVEEARINASHTEVIEGDVLEVTKRLPAKSYDAVVALDLLEHLDKADGRNLLKEMVRVSRRVCVIGTPNGFLPQEATANPLQKHRSGWSGIEMKEEGFNVIGLFGPRFFRGHGHELRFRPTAVWGVLARFCHEFWTRRNVKLAAGLLCVKFTGACAEKSIDGDRR